MVWKPGESGNPKGLPGRPLGARHKIASAFLADAYSEWERSGKRALKRMAEDDPSKFVQVVSALLPKESAVDIKVAVEQRFAQMSYTELLALRDAYDAASASAPLIENNSEGNE